MAEFEGLDELLSGSLKRAAQPGDSAGVADTIRARVAAGDTGTPAPSGSGPGFGSAIGSWLPWVGLLVVGAIVGGALGVTGVAGRPQLHETSANSSILIGLNVAARACPGGPVVAELTPGSRVLALARSEDGASVQVRNPADTRTEVWIPVSKLETDSGQPAVSTLPVGTACPVAKVPVPTVVKPVTPVTPTKPTKPGAPKDTTKPTVGKPTADFENCATKISVTASDNVGVTSVTISWSGPANNGSGSMNRVGGHWEYTTSGFHDTLNNTFKVTAHDAAGNSSPTKSVVAQTQCVI